VSPACRRGAEGENRVAEAVEESESRGVGKDELNIVDLKPPSAHPSLPPTLNMDLSSGEFAVILGLSPGIDAPAAKILHLSEMQPLWDVVRFSSSLLLPPLRPSSLLSRSIFYPRWS